MEWAGQGEAGRHAVLRLEGELTISEVARWKEALVEALRRGDRVSLDPESLREIDAAGLQLLCAAHRSALGQGKLLELLGSPSGNPVGRAAEAAGLRRRKGCAEGCLWEEVTHG